jgi:ribosomal protein S18 acetylase RimI-like enzyme
MGSFSLRPATAEDALAIAHVQVRSWQEGYRGQLPDQVLDELDPAARAAERARRMRDPDNPGRTLVAVDDDTGTVIGFTEFGPGCIDEDCERMTDEEGQVYTIYVDPPHWGRGAGRALLAAAVLELTRDRPRPVRLWVLSSNERTRRFYERFGFALDGSTSTFRIERGDQPALEFDDVRYVFHRAA